jgi:hypothetical protein
MDYYNGDMGPAGFAGGFQQVPQQSAQANNMQAQGMQQPIIQMPRAQYGPAGSDTDAELKRFMDEGYLMGPGCFDKDSQTYAKQLLEYINDEFHDHIYYMIISKRAPTQTARRMFRDMARRRAQTREAVGCGIFSYHRQTILPYPQQHRSRKRSIKLSRGTS